MANERFDRLLPHSLIPSSLPRVRRAGFTLIELLTVIAIIGMLAAILIPTVSKVRISARKAKVRTELNGWAVAIETFKSEYGFYPDIKGVSGGKVNGGSFNATFSSAHFFHDVLAGKRRDGSTPSAGATDPLGQSNNRKRISFVTFGPDEVTSSGKIVDAFGNEDIAVIIDTNHDGIILPAEFSGVSVQAGSPVSGSSFAPPSSKIPTNGVRAGVVLFSAGPGTSANDIVYSWQ